MSTTPEKVFAQLKNAKGLGDVTRALTQDPYLLVGIISLFALVYLFGRIYIWPWINPFQFKWVSNLWDWATSPRKATPTETYPYAKVIYPTYR